MFINVGVHLVYDLIASGYEGGGNVFVLAGEVLVDEEDFHGCNFTGHSWL